MRRSVRGLVVAAVVLLAAGCTDDPEPPPTPDATPALATLSELDPLWTTDLGAEVEPLEADVGATGSRGDLTTWSTADGLVLVGRTQLTGLDADGTVAWTFPVPDGLGPVCRAGAPNDAGLAPVLFGDGLECRTLGLFDLGTQQLRWTRDLGERSGDIGADVRPEDANLYAGAERVVVPTFCDGVLAFSTATGEPLDSDLASAREDGCVVEMQISGSAGVVVQRRDGGDVLSRRDLDTDEVLWQLRVERTRLHSVVSVDPLVVDLESDGARLVQRFDDTGQPVDLGFEARNGPLVQGVADGVLALSYDLAGPLDPGATYRGFDVETGEQLWRTTEDQAFVLGRVGDDLLLAGDAAAGDDPDEAPALVLGRAGFGDPLEQAGTGAIRVEGRFGLDYRAGWTDELFLVLRGSELSAYDLTADAGAALPQAEVEEPAYAEGEVSAEQAVDVCQVISAPTLAGLGIDRGDLPPPASCSFTSAAGDAGFRNLVVEVFPLAPDEESTGTERAERTLTEFLSQDRESNPEYGEPQPVTGVGDEAVVSTIDGPSQQQARLMARWRNVVFVVTVRTDLSAAEDPGDRPGLDALRTGVGQVVVELVTELGARAQ